MKSVQRAKVLISPVMRKRELMTFIGIAAEEPGPADRVACEYYETFKTLRRRSVGVPPTPAQLVLAAAGKRIFERVAPSGLAGHVTALSPSDASIDFTMQSIADLLPSEGSQRKATPWGGSQPLRHRALGRCRGHPFAPWLRP